MTKDQKKPKIKIEQEKEDKIVQAEASELLDQITQEDESKAAPIIIEKQKEAEKAALEDKMLKEADLQASRITRKEYLKRLADTAFEMAKYIDWPVGYTYFIGFNEEKLKVVINVPDGRKFAKGIKACGVPSYDLNAIGILLTQCENTIDYIMNRGSFRKDGIILSDE